MTLHTKTLAGVPSVSLIECPSAGIKTNLFGFSKDPFHRTERQSYKDSLFKYIGACTDRTPEQCNLMACDLTEIVRRYKVWAEELPRVKPFYAVKCNPDPLLLKVLSACNVNYDCASTSEIEKVLSIGVDPSRIIFANAAKFRQSMEFASNADVRRTTFDSECELRKISKFWPKAECVLRLLPPIYKAQCNLALKFGAELHTVPSLLNKARKLKLNVVGISFHVGSGCYEAQAWAESVRMAKHVADTFPSYGFEMKLLDIGGGFPGHSPGLGEKDVPEFSDITQHLRLALDEEFPVESGVEIIAEPGRYFASSAYTCAAQVYSKRTVMEEIERNDEETKQDREEEDKEEKKTAKVLVTQLYVGDGVYGSFNNTLFDHQVVRLSAILTPGENADSHQDSCTESDPEHEWSVDNENNSAHKIQPINLQNQPVTGDVLTKRTCVFGPTCDSIDRFYLHDIPSVELNDWLVWRDMGAYTVAASSKFNGMPLPKMFYFLYNPTKSQLRVIREALDLGEPEDDDPNTPVIFV